VVDYMINYFLSFFQNPSAWGIGLAIGFGVVWLAAYWPPLFRKPWLWAVLVSSPFLTLAAVCFIQVPLETWMGQALAHFWSQEVLARWILVVGIPAVLLSGLVQEGAKMVPMVVYWSRSGKNIDPKLGLAIGAVAGAGFGIFEAQWMHNLIFASGWTWAAVQTGGFMALLGFWERFFTVAAHIAFSALAGYGLTRVLTGLHLEIYAAVLAAAVTTWALWLRWRKGADTAQPELETGTGTETGISAP